MKITVHTQYQVAGKFFDTLQKAENHIDDLLGRFVERMLNAGRYGPKDRLHVHQFLRENSVELSNLLRIEYPEDDDD